MGRPLKFATVEELEKRIEAYFRDCDREEDTRVFAHGKELLEKLPYIDEKTNKRRVRNRIVCDRCRRDFSDTGCRLVSGSLKLRKPYTITGLAVALDTSRQTLLNYEIRPEFFDTIKRAKQRIEYFAEESLFDRDRPTKGVIFSLSNNSEGWADRMETKVTVEKDPVEGLAEALFAKAGGARDTVADAPPARPDPAPTGETA